MEINSVNFSKFPCHCFDAVKPMIIAMEESSSGSNRNSQDQKEMIHTQKYLGFSGDACGIGDHFYRERDDFIKKPR
jgi:hypothetical protein